LAKTIPGKWRVVRGRASLEDAVAEWERLHPFDAGSDADYSAAKAALGHTGPEADPSYAAAKAETEAGGTTIAHGRWPGARPDPPPAPPPERTPEERRDQERREVEAKRDELIADPDSRYHGYGTIGARLGFSPTKVRRLLGKG
jgi:hypothetical protein